MTLTFRPAEPADVEAAIPLIYSSGPAAFDFVFTVPGKGDPNSFLRSAFLDGDGEFGYRNHVVGINEGQVVAVGGAWNGTTGLAFMLAGARQILGCYGLWSGLGVIVRGLRTEAVIPPPSSGHHYLGHLGVKPDLQNRGLGQALILHLIAQEKPARLRMVSLDVAVTNPRGQALYERLGFVVTRERLSRLSNAHGAVVNHRHMEKSIEVSKGSTSP